MVKELLEIRIREGGKDVLPNSLLFYRHMPIKSKYLEKVCENFLLFLHVFYLPFKNKVCSWEVQEIFHGCERVQKGYRPKLTYIGLAVR